jgi:hypothetical protein
MPMTPEKREERLRATASGCDPFLEDLQHMRDVLNDPKPDGIRRMSAILRRMLVEGNLLEIASPRIGSIELMTVEMKGVERSNRSSPLPFFAAGGADIHGVAFGGVLFTHGTGKPTPEFHPDNRILVKADNFLKQYVICINGKWITRGDVVKYIANVAGGVHGGKIKDGQEALVRRARHVFSMDLSERPPRPLFNFGALGLEDLPLTLDRKAIDCVLGELLSAATLLVRSEDVLELEKLLLADGPMVSTLSE